MAVIQRPALQGNSISFSVTAQAVNQPQSSTAALFA